MHLSERLAVEHLPVKFALALRGITATSNPGGPRLGPKLNITSAGRRD
jgi:hypothetical protein